MNNLKHILLMAMLCVLGLRAYAQDMISFSSADNAVCLWNSNDKNLTIAYDANDFKGVTIALNNLKNDISALGATATLSSASPKDARVVVGTLGKSALVGKLLPKKLQKELAGKREKYFITTTDKGQVIIAGSDKRGTIYGIYELSARMGVSPWYYWADVPVIKQDEMYLLKGEYTEGEPAVRYRGIFLNDEWPAMGNWANEKFGGFNSKMYAKVFELVLRLKGNFMWPAMWNSAFYADDPLNMQTADDMGIIMGTSHHEPLGRAQQEWTRVRTRGPWNYDTNQKELNDFWRGGAARMKDTEDVLTIGMRGNGDEPMSAHADVALLEKIVADQRNIIAEATGRPAEKTPQVWALYKEVQEYYEKGMRVPDDVILLLCDDNWGDVRLLPELGGKHHKGGYGMYYHVDYVGGPRNSKWLNVSQIQRMWEQLQLTYTYGVDKLWILNVGDLKPMEFPIDFWFKMAWDPSQFNAGNLIDYTESFCAQQFGADQAKEAARILNLACKYAHRKTAELLDKNTYSLDNGEWDIMLNRYKILLEDAQKQYASLKPEYRDAYYQVVLFPVEAMANIYDLHYSYAKNQKLANEGKQEANYWADRAYSCYQADSVLCAYYNHELAGGKWNHMMDQLHIGYTSWQEPNRRYFPAPLRVDEEGKIIQTQNQGQRGFGGFGGGFGGNRQAPAAPAVHRYYEAAAYKEATDAAKAKWTNIPYFGIYESGIALMPYTESTEGASVTYEVEVPSQPFHIRLHLAPSFPFNDNKGQRVRVMMAGDEIKEININQRYNENAFQGNRINIQDITVDNAGAKYSGKQTLCIAPLDPGVVIERVEIAY